MAYLRLREVLRFARPFLWLVWRSTRMIKRMCVVFAVLASSPVLAETWQATTQLVPQSPSSCPTVSLVYELSLERALFTGKAPNGAAFSGNVGSNGAVRVQYVGSPQAGTVTITGNAIARQLEMSASGLPKCRYALASTGGAPPVPTPTSSALVGCWGGELRVNTA